MRDLARPVEQTWRAPPARTL